MFSILSGRWLLAACTAIWLLNPLQLTAAELTYTQALQLAASQNALLEARQRELQAAESRATSAGRLPDPRLTSGLNNIPIGSHAFSLNSDFMTMRSLGVTQDFPSPAKRNAERQLASAEIEMAEARLLLDSIRAHTETSSAWLRLYYIDRQLDVLTHLLEDNNALQTSVQTQTANGESAMTDLLQVREEAAAILDRRDTLNAERARWQAVLHQWTGTSDPVQTTGAPPLPDIDAELLRASLHNHPGLALFEPRDKQLQAQLAAAEADKKPDWSLAVEYSSRNRRFGDMLSLRVNVDLPLFTSTRQTPRIIARRQEAEALAAEFEFALAGMHSELENHLAELERLTAVIERQHSQWLPLAEQRETLLTTAWRNGQAPLSDVVEARLTLLERRLTLLGLERDHAIMASYLQLSHGSGHHAHVPLDPSDLNTAAHQTLWEPLQ